MGDSSHWTKIIGQGRFRRSGHSISNKCFLPKWRFEPIVTESGMSLLEQNDG